MIMMVESSVLSSVWCSPFGRSMEKHSYHGQTGEKENNILEKNKMSPLSVIIRYKTQ